MLNLTPFAPVEASDVTVHIVLNDFGDLGRAYVETLEQQDLSVFLSVFLFRTPIYLIELH